MSTPEHGTPERGKQGDHGQDGRQGLQGHTGRQGVPGVSGKDVFSRNQTFLLVILLIIVLTAIGVRAETAVNDLEQRVVQLEQQQE